MWRVLLVVAGALLVVLAAGDAVLLSTTQTPVRRTPAATRLGPVRQTSNAYQQACAVSGPTTACNTITGVTMQTRKSGG